MGLQWYHNYAQASDFILESTHKGPIQIFLAKSETGAGNVWFKVYEDGYNPSTGQWATDKLIANRGRIDFTIPADIAPGNYLVRGEVLALHNAYDVYGIQPYVGCVEITITGSGSATPSGVAFPGYYTPSGPGMLFDVYKSYNSYTIPGPALYVPGTAPTTAPTSAPTAAPTSAPTAAPTAAPTSAPTSVPTSAPTARPTTAPPTQATTKPTTQPTAQPTIQPTSQPTTQPTSRPTSSSTVKCRLNSGSNAWWVGIIPSNPEIVKIEIMDGSALRSWAPLTDLTYAYVFSESIQLSLPLSVRFTSNIGKQVIATNVITSWTTSDVIDTGLTFPSY